MAKFELMKRPVKKVGGSIKKTAWMSIFEALAAVVLGVLLVVFSDNVIKIVSYVVGGFFIVKGLYQIINYFVVNGMHDYYNNDLLWGVISCLAGVAVFVAGDKIGAAFRIVLGIWIIYSALVRMNSALKMHAVGIRSWGYVLIIALITLVFGAFIALYDGAFVVLIGWLMIVSGLIDVIGDILFIQNIEAIMNKILNNDISEK